ncbi:uncharacterized protein [Macrobrachium rosenbergii]|uniref:uncharacterized protein n=1 Tax=Macrobrachium rosenbergii TaxID=79674 RepID=UPI0034D69F7C
MKRGSVQIAFVVWVAMVLNDSAESVPLPEQLSRSLTRSQGLGDIQSSSPSDYSDAIYAGKFAIELDRLEKQQRMFTKTLSLLDLQKKKFPVIYQVVCKNCLGPPAFLRQENSLFLDRSGSGFLPRKA